MPKRTSEAAELPTIKESISSRSTKSARKPGAGSASAGNRAPGADEGMGEFEDQWEDDVESDGEVIQEAEEDEDSEDEDEDEEEGEGIALTKDQDGDEIMINSKLIPAMEDAEMDDQEDDLPEPEPYLPTSRALLPDETLEPDHSVYLALHSLSYTWPCLSFDVLRDSGGWERSRFPHTSYVVAGTQAGGEAGPSGSFGKPKDEVVVMKWGGLSKTQKDGDGETDSDEDDDEDDVDEVDEEAHLEFLSIPHAGSVNRIRAQPLAPSPALLPPMGTPYYTATMSETGKVHIFDVRPMLDTLENPATAPTRSDASKRPVHTIGNHGRQEGFALDWASSSSGSELRLLSGDISSQIYLTTSTQSTFTTQPKPFLSHTSSVEDIQWSPSEPTVFASCSADRSIRVWDVRVKSRRSVVAIEGAHEEDVNVISWNKAVEYLVVSGGDEGGLKVWDLRNLKGTNANNPPVAHFTWHKSPITSLEWHPTDTSLFCASSADDSVTLWDLSVEADDEETASHAITSNGAEGLTVPPQLLFVHQGQKDVKEVHWHPQIPGMVCSTAGDGFNAFKTISA